MLRFLAGAAACFLLMTGAFLMWQSHAEQGPSFPGAPTPRAFSASMVSEGSLQAPEASAKSREEKRFSRYDHNKNGKVEADEYLAARQRNFDKLDSDHNGALSFREYAIKGIDKFDDAGGKKGWLSPAEFVKTAPPPPKRRTCSCGSTYASRSSSEDSSED